MTKVNGMFKQILAGIILTIFLWFFNRGNQPTAGSHHTKTLIKPAFQTVTSDAVREAIQIVSSRSTAAFGLNTPLVRIYLPRIDNSAYAVVTFDKPQLMNQRGQPVAHELERAGYDKTLYADEIRFAIPGGSGTVVYGRAKGSGTIKYPLKITTHSVRTNTTGGDATAIINGNRVTYIDENEPALAFQQSAIGPIRAYDAAGQQLSRAGYNAVQIKNEIKQRTLAFNGEIAQVQIDTVTQWAEFVFTYDLPPTKRLPDSYSGLVVSRPPKIAPTPGGIVSITLLEPQNQTSAPKNLRGSPKKSTPGLQRFHRALSMPMTPYNIAALQQMIQDGIDVITKDRVGRTPLHLVAYRCDAADVVRALIAAGANVNAKTANGHTPLWLAQQMMCQKNIHLIMNAGGN